MYLKSPRMLPLPTSKRHIESMRSPLSTLSSFTCMHISFAQCWRRRRRRKQKKDICAHPSHSTTFINVKQNCGAQRSQQLDYPHRLSLANHPDKSNKHDAPERFMVIAKAYEVGLRCMHDRSDSQGRTCRLQSDMRVSKLTGGSNC
jgi:hypothetical protein